ncbi:unnamed protein product, partial [Polarella glacialis]
CPLHVFEPRYRCMMRRAVSSGHRLFGMCLSMSGSESQNGYSKIGTALFIREIRMLPDGRSLIDTVGERRFRVIETGERDGYNVARVEYFANDEERSKRAETAVAPTPEELAQETLADGPMAQCRTLALKVRQALRQRLSMAGPLALLLAGEQEDGDGIMGRGGFAAGVYGHQVPTSCSGGLG